MPSVYVFDGNGNLTHQDVLTDEQLAAEEDEQRERVLDAADLVAFRALFNHENRIRALERFARGINTTAAGTAGVPALPRPDLTMLQFRAALKSLLP